MRLRSPILNDVAATSLITLFAHAQESLSPDPILRDAAAVEIADRLKKEFLPAGHTGSEDFFRDRVPYSAQIYICLRACFYDRLVRDFLARYPSGVVVDLGCGLNTRFSRIDNGSVHYYDLDLPKVIALKRHFLEESSRYRFLPFSMFDYRWMNDLEQAEAGPFLFLAEGVFMYFRESEIRAFVLQLQEVFPECELVCEVFFKLWLKAPWKALVNQKMQRLEHLPPGTGFEFGLAYSREMETWHKGIEFLDDWSYLDSGSPKLGWLIWFRNNELFRKTLWTVHYQLHAKPN